MTYDPAYVKRWRLDRERGIRRYVPAEPVRVKRDPRPGGRRIDLDEWTHLVLGGESPERAAHRLGVTLGAVERAAHRHGREDVLDRIHQGRVA